MGPTTSRRRSASRTPPAWTSPPGSPALTVRAPGATARAPSVPVPLTLVQSFAPPGRGCLWWDQYHQDTESGLRVTPKNIYYFAPLSRRFTLTSWCLHADFEMNSCLAKGRGRRSLHYIATIKRIDCGSDLFALAHSRLGLPPCSVGRSEERRRQGGALHWRCPRRARAVGGHTAARVKLLARNG